MRKYIDLFETATASYQGEHRAPTHEDGAALYDLTMNDIYPADVYGPRGYQYDAHAVFSEGFSKAMTCKGRPNRVVTVYRAVPKEVRPLRINPGDWVSLSRDYAREHGMSNLNGYRIIKKTVHARDLYTEGNSLDEWGYDPQPSFTYQQEDEIRERLGMETKTAARARLAQERE